ncbi:MAG: hypothetical protein Q3972_04500 [Corynebacterium sp.]|nr:hypothetical protein [Corynebacterium sp.]
MLIFIPLIAVMAPYALPDADDSAAQISEVRIGVEPVGSLKCKPIYDVMFDSWDCGDARIYTAEFDLSSLEDNPQYEGDRLLEHAVYRFYRAVNYMDYEAPRGGFTKEGDGIIATADNGLNTGTIMAARAGDGIVWVAYVEDMDDPTYSKPFVDSLKSMILGTDSNNRGGVNAA